MLLKRQLWLCAPLMAAVLVGCTNVPVKPFSSASDAVPTSQDAQRIWHQAQQQDEAFQKEGATAAYGAQQKYLQGIVDKLYPKFRGTMHVHLIRSTIPNAFTLPNGSIYIDTGLLLVLQNEAQLATVLAHEGAHFVLRHGLQEYEHTTSTLALMRATSAFGLIGLLGSTIEYGSIFGYSRSMEHQADVTGYKHLVRAGYDPAQAVVAFQRLDATAKVLDLKQPVFFASHPSMANRIGYFQAELAASPAATGVVDQAAYEKVMRVPQMDALRDLLGSGEGRLLIFFLKDSTRLAALPPTAGYYLARGYMLRNRPGDDARALSTLQQTIKRAPLFAPAYRATGMVQMKMEHAKEALRAFKRYLKLEPNAADIGYVNSYISKLQATGDVQ